MSQLADRRAPRGVARSLPHMALALGLTAAGAIASSSQSTPGGLVAVRAGTIYVVDGGTVLTGGATLVVKDGKILAVGNQVEVPAGARLVDYGPDSVLIPGLVAVNSNYNVDSGSDRTADVAVRAIDGFSFYSSAPLRDVAAGVTTAYLAPARGRLIAGVGGVVKLAGEKRDGRILSEVAAIQGSIGPEVRGLSGYWEPPIPSTSDVGLGYAEPQLPATTMGALVALREIARLARNEKVDGDYGRDLGPALAPLMEDGVRWRMGANTPAEIRALLGFAKEQSLPLVIEGAAQAAGVAKEIAAAGAEVVFVVDYPAAAAPVLRGGITLIIDGQVVQSEDGEASGSGRALGQDPDDAWPTNEGAADLAAAGVRLAIATPDHAHPRDLRFAAGLACRGGLDPRAALRAITLGAAEVLGVDQRVGSLRPGKDADFVVLSGDPISNAGVIATWVDGNLAFEGWDNARSTGASGRSAARLGGMTGLRSSERREAPKPSPVVFDVDELYVGDGKVLRPGQLSVKDGRILEVGERVSRPSGAITVRAKAAMPGIIDALGHLGMEGSSKVPPADFRWSRSIEPGNDLDKRVAKAGVTTVLLGSPGTSNVGTPIAAYKPASSDLERMVLADPAMLRMSWSNPNNRIESGEKVREVLAKASAYAKKWNEYEAALAKWNASSDGKAAQDAAQGKGSEDAAPDESKDKDADKKSEGEKKEGEKKEEAKDEKKPDEKKKSDKKQKEEPEADPVTGVWEGSLKDPPEGTSKSVRLQLELSGDKVTGSLRAAAISDELLLVAGTWKEAKLELVGLSRRGWARVQGSAKQGKLEGTLHVAGESHAFEAERKQKEVPKANRPERRKEEPTKVAEPKGKPKEPGLDPKLEPLRQAMLGKASVLVDVDRRDEVLAAVQAFADVGIRPVLMGNSEVCLVVEQVKDRIQGAILPHQIHMASARKGLMGERNLHTELTDAGVPVAFFSDAEEGAADLWVMAAYAVANGMSPNDALRALTCDAARICSVASRVGQLAEGQDADVLLLDGPPLEPATRILRTWVDGVEVR